MADVSGSPEYTPASDRPWRMLLDASGELDRVAAEYIGPLGQVGATEARVALAAAILQARAAMAAVDALQGIRQELTLTNSLLAQLRP